MLWFKGVSLVLAVLALVSGLQFTLASKLRSRIEPGYVVFGQGVQLQITLAEMPFPNLDLHDCIFFQFTESHAGAFHNTSCLTPDDYAHPMTCVKIPGSRGHGCMQLTFYYTWHSAYTELLTTNPALVAVYVRHSAQEGTATPTQWMELNQPVYVIPVIEALDPTSVQNGVPGFRVEAVCHRDTTNKLSPGGNCSLGGGARLTTPPTLGIPSFCTAVPSSVATLSCVWQNRGPSVHSARELEEEFAVHMYENYTVTASTSCVDGVLTCPYEGIATGATWLDLHVRIVFLDGTSIITPSRVPVGVLATVYGEHDIIEGPIDTYTRIVLEGYFFPEFVDWTIVIAHEAVTRPLNVDPFFPESSDLRLSGTIDIVRDDIVGKPGLKRIVVPLAISALELVSTIKRSFLFPNVYVWFASTGPGGGVKWIIRLPLRAGRLLIENVNVLPVGAAAGIEPSILCGLGNIPLVPELITPTLVVCTVPAFIYRTETFPLSITYDGGSSWINSSSMFHYFPLVHSVFPSLVPAAKATELNLYVDGLTKDCQCVYGPYSGWLPANFSRVNAENTMIRCTFSPFGTVRRDVLEYVIIACGHRPALGQRKLSQYQQPNAPAKLPGAIFQPSYVTRQNQSTGTFNVKRLARNSFIVQVRPQISYVFPPEVPNHGGGIIHVHGEHFRSDRNIKCIFEQKGLPEPILVNPTVLTERYITCKTPAISLFCSYSENEAETLKDDPDLYKDRCEDEASCYCEENVFVMTSLYVSNDVVPDIQPVLHYASEPVLFRFYNAEFIVTGAAPLGPAKDTFLRYQPLPTTIDIQEFGGLKISILGRGFRPGMRRVDPLSVSSNNDDVEEVEVFRDEGWNATTLRKPVISRYGKDGYVVAQATPSGKAIRLSLFDFKYRRQSMAMEDANLGAPYLDATRLGIPVHISIVDLPDGFAVFWQQEILGHGYWSVFGQFYDVYGRRRKRGTTLTDNPPYCQLQSDLGAFEVTNCFVRSAECSQLRQSINIGDCPTREPHPQAKEYPSGLIVMWNGVRNKVEYKLFQHSYKTVVVDVRGYEFRNEVMAEMVVAAFFHTEWSNAQCQRSSGFSNNFKARVKRDRPRINSHCGTDMADKGSCETIKDGNDCADSNTESLKIFVQNGDYILLAAETDATMNGIYTFDSSFTRQVCDAEAEETGMPCDFMPLLRRGTHFVDINGNVVRHIMSMYDSHKVLKPYSRFAHAYNHYAHVFETPTFTTSFMDVYRDTATMCFALVSPGGRRIITEGSVTVPPGEGCPRIFNNVVQPDGTATSEYAPPPLSSISPGKLGSVYDSDTETLLKEFLVSYEEDPECPTQWSNGSHCYTGAFLPGSPKKWNPANSLEDIFFDLRVSSNEIASHLMQRIIATAEYQNKRTLYSSCLLKENGGANAADDDCTTTIKRTVAKGFVLERNENNSPITVGADKQQWKSLGTNTNPIECTGDHSEPVVSGSLVIRAHPGLVTCRSPKSNDHSVAIGTPYIIQNQFFSNAMDVFSSVKTFSFVHDYQKNGWLAALLLADNDQLYIAYHNMSQEWPLQLPKVHEMILIPDKTQHIVSCESPSKDGFAMAYATNASMIVVRKFLWDTRNESKPIYLRIPQNHTISLQWISVLSGSYVVAWISASEMDGNHSKLTLMRVKDTVNSTTIHKMLKSYPDMEGNLNTQTTGMPAESAKGPHAMSYDYGVDAFDMFSSSFANTDVGRIVVLRNARWAGLNMSNVLMSNLQDSFCKCQFGVQNVFATYVSDHEIVCTIPESVIQIEGSSTETVKVALTFNSLDYSDTNVFVRYYESCFPGTYASDDIDPLRSEKCSPCPRGHSCPLRGQTSPSACLPGTFQPLPGASRCKKCPLGYYCPSLAMTEPILCSPGYVCGVVGTTIPVTACPQGHYCLAGTAVSLGDCCASGPALGHVATFGDSANLNTPDQQALLDKIKFWGDPRAMSEVPEIEKRISSKDVGHWPVWFPPFEADQADSSNLKYTCGQGPGANGRPCCTCYKEPRKTRGDECTGRLYDLDIEQFSCAEPETNVTFSPSFLSASDGPKYKYRRVTDFPKKNGEPTPTPDNCKHIYVLGSPIPNIQLAPKCLGTHDTVFCRVQVVKRKVFQRDSSTVFVSKKSDNEQTTDEQAAEEQTVYSCISDHQGDEDIKQEGSLFARPLKIASAEVVQYESASSGGNGSTAAYKRVRIKTVEEHHFQFQDLIELNSIITPHPTKVVNTEITDAEVEVVEDPFTIIVEIESTVDVEPFLNYTKAFVMTTRATRYDAFGLPEHNLGKRKSLFPEGFWRDLWIPVSGLHTIDVTNNNHVRPVNQTGYDYTRQVLQGWEVKLVDEETREEQVFVVSADGLFGPHVITIEKKEYDYDNSRFVVPWWSLTPSPAIIKPVTSGKMYKRYPGVADRTAKIVGRPLLCTSGSYCGTGVGASASLPCSARNKIDGVCNLTPQPCAEGFKCNSGAKTPQGDNECTKTRFCASAVVVEGDDFKLSESREICRLATKKDDGSYLIRSGYLRTTFFGFEPGLKGDCVMAHGNGCNPPRGNNSNESLILNRICQVSFTTGDLSTMKCALAHEDAFYCNCLLGYSCPTRGMREPTECSAGTFNDQNNAEMCHPCLIGFMCPDSATVFPKICPAGFICDNEGLVREQTLCSAGFVCLVGVRTVLPRPEVEDEFIKCTTQSVYARLGRSLLSAASFVECNYTMSLYPANTKKHVYGDVSRTTLLRIGAMDEIAGVRAHGNLLFNLSHGENNEYGSYEEMMIANNAPLTEYDPMFNPHYIENQYNVDVGVGVRKNATHFFETPSEYLRVAMLTLKDLYWRLAQLTFKYTIEVIHGILYYMKRRPTSTNTVTVEMQNLLRLLRAPLPCPSAYYCLSGIKDFTQITGIVVDDVYVASAIPALCLEGTYCLQGTSNPSGTGKCMKGFRCPIGISKPIPSSPGKFTLSASGRLEQQCFAGRFTRQTGRWFCSLCPKGFICHVESGGSPELKLDYRNDTTICYAGYACDQKGQAAPPTKCPNGHFCVEGTASSTTSTEISLTPLMYDPTNRYRFILIPNAPVAVVTCENQLTSDTDICDITSSLDRGDSIEIMGEVFQVSTNLSLPFGPHCIMYGGNLDVTCNDEAKSSPAALGYILKLYPALCASMLPSCTDEAIDDFVFAQSFEADSSNAKENARYTEPATKSLMYWPLQIIPLNRAHSYYTDAAAVCNDNNTLSNPRTDPPSTGDTCIEQTNNGLMPANNERVSAFMIGAKECLRQNLCSVRFERGKREASVLLSNVDESFNVMTTSSWKSNLTDPLVVEKPYPYLTSASQDKFELRGVNSAASHAADSNTLAMTECKLLRFWGADVRKLIEPDPGYCRKLRPRKCQLVPITHPTLCNGEDSYWDFNVGVETSSVPSTTTAAPQTTNNSTNSLLIASLEFSHARIVDYVELEMRNFLTLKNPIASTYDYNVTGGPFNNETATIHFVVEKDYSRGILNASRPNWQYCNNHKTVERNACTAWTSIDPCGCGVEAIDIMQCSCLFPNSERLDRALYERKHTHIMLESSQGYIINWGIGMIPQLQLSRAPRTTHLLRRVPGLIYIEMEYANIESVGLADKISGVEDVTDSYEGKTGEEFAMSPPGKGMEWILSHDQGKHLTSLNPLFFIAPRYVEPEQNHMIRQHVMHIINESDFLNGTVQHERYTMRYLRSVKAKVNLDRINPSHLIGVKLAKFRAYERQEVYRDGTIEMAKLAVQRDDESHFQQNIFPFPQSSDDKSTNKTTCCAHPLPCAEGTYCLRGVSTSKVDFTGEDFGAPLWCLAGNYCPVATASSAGSGACPAGYYCPPGTSIPKPCWKGHKCPGSGNFIPKICPPGTYSNAGPYPPITPEKATSIEDLTYKEFAFDPTTNVFGQKTMNPNILKNLPSVYLGERRCLDYCCSLTNTIGMDGVARPASEVNRVRLEFGVAPGTVGKCQLSIQCLHYPGKDYGCVGEVEFKGNAILGSYDFDYYPDNETDGKPHWQNIPQPFATVGYVRALKRDGVITETLEDIIARNKVVPPEGSYYQSYSHQSGIIQGNANSRPLTKAEVLLRKQARYTHIKGAGEALRTETVGPAEGKTTFTIGEGGINWNQQSIDPEDLSQFNEALKDGGLEASSLRRFSLEECPPNMIKDCDEVCFPESFCLIVEEGKPDILNCSMLISDSICHNGTDKTKPNFNCMRFGCDGGDCSDTCEDELMEAILDVPFTGSCEFWHKKVHEGRKIGANMCGESIIPKNNLDDDQSNDVEPGLINVCRECSKFHVGPYLYPESTSPMKNYYSSFRYRPDTETSAERLLGLSHGQKNEKLGLWDENKDGPTEIYFNPAREWWQVPVTASAGMSFGCSPNDKNGNIVCPRFFNFSKAKFAEFDALEEYKYLKKLIIDSIALRSGRWYEFGPHEKIQRKYGGGHSLAKTVCAVQMELYERWLHDTIPCAGSLAGMETNVEDEASTDDTTYDKNGLKRSDQNPAYKDALQKLNSGASFGLNMKSTYDAAMFLSYYVGQNMDTFGKTFGGPSNWDEGVSEFLSTVLELANTKVPKLKDSFMDTKFLPRPMNGVTPNLNFIYEFYAEVNEKLPTDDERKRLVFQKYLKQGLINVTAYPSQFYGSHFHKRSNDLKDDDNTALKRRLFEPEDPADPDGIKSCSASASRLKWEPEDFRNAISSITLTDVADRIYRAMVNCGENNMAVSSKTIISKWPFYPLLQGQSRRVDLAENHKPYVSPLFHLEYDAGRRVSTSLYSAARVVQQDTSCGQIGTEYYCGELNRDVLGRADIKCRDCCVGEMKCFYKAKFTTSSFTFKKEVLRYVNTRTPSNQTRYWLNTGLLTEDYWHEPTDLLQEHEKKVVCRFKLGKTYEPSECTQKIEIGFHLLFVRDECSLPLASTFVRVPSAVTSAATEQGILSGLFEAGANRPYEYMHDGKKADGWHQSDSPCFKVFDANRFTATLGITRAYRFPEAVAMMDSLGKISTAGTNTMREYDVRGKSVSIELWMRPDNRKSASGVLFETGDANWTECSCSTMAESLAGFDSTSCDSNSDLYTPWSLYQLADKEGSSREGSMLCNAGLAVLLVDGAVVVKLNPLFGKAFNISVRLPSVLNEGEDFYHIIASVEMSIPWSRCEQKDWCGSHEFHRDIRLTLFINSRYKTSGVCYGCGSWTSLDAVGLGGSATGGLGFSVQSIEKHIPGCAEDDVDCNISPFERAGDPIVRRRAAWECERCSDPLKITMDIENLNGDWLPGYPHFEGYISLFRVYKSALTAADARQNYNAYTVAGGVTMPYPPTCTKSFSPYSCPRQDALYGSDDLQGLSGCTSCPDGYYCPKEGTIYPIQCPLGSYQAGLNAKSCNMCPAGTWSNKQKLANVFECSPCENGHVCEIPGNRDMDVFALLPKTTLCPEGNYCMQGTTKATNTEFKCAPGLFCSFGTKPPDDFQAKGTWVARSQEIAQDRAACARFSTLYVPWSQAPWSIVSGEILPICMWKYSGSFNFRGVIGHYLYNNIIRQMHDIDTASIGVATIRNKVSDQCHENSILGHGGCLETILMDNPKEEDRRKGTRSSLYYGREFTHPDMILRCSQNAVAGGFPPPEPMSPDKNIIPDRYGKIPNWYNFRQFRYMRCIENVEDPNDPMFLEIAQGLTNIMTMGHPWYDDTVGQHIRDLKSYFRADFTSNTKLLFRNMPQAMIDYVAGACKRKQLQQAYEIWLGSTKKIIQPKDTTGYSLPPRLLQERLYAPAPEDPTRLDDDTIDRGEFIAFEELWMKNKPDDVVYDNSKQRDHKVISNPSNCQRFWANQFQEETLLAHGETIFKNVRDLWKQHRSYPLGSANRACKLVRTGSRHTRAYFAKCPAWHDKDGVLDQFDRLPSMGKQMLFKELHQFHHETFPYIAKFESGPFYKCPSGYACGEGTKASDSSRLDKSCGKGFFCPIGTPGPQPNLILIEKLNGFECHKNRCRRPSNRVTAQWALSIGENISTAAIGANINGFETYDRLSDQYVKQNLSITMGKICDPYDTAEVSAKINELFINVLAEFAGIDKAVVTDTFESNVYTQQQCTCASWTYVGSTGTCGNRRCNLWKDCAGDQEYSGALNARKQEIDNERMLYFPLPGAVLYYVTLVFGPYAIRCRRQNVKSCHEVEYGPTINGAGNLENRINFQKIQFFEIDPHGAHSPLCDEMTDATVESRWDRAKKQFVGIDASKCVNTRYRMDKFCLRRQCVGKVLSTLARDRLLLCSTRHTMKVRNKLPDGSGDFFCAAETCEARDQSGVTLPYEIPEFECRFNWEEFICPTGTSSMQNSLAPVDCLIDWSCASQNIPMYKNLFGNVGSSTLKVEDDPMPFDCPLRLNDVILLYEPRFVPGSTEPFTRATNALKLEMAKVYRIEQVKSDSQLVMGDRWILGKWGFSALYDGIQGFKKALHVNRRPQIYLNTLRECFAHEDDMKTSFVQIDCLGNNNTANEAELPLTVDDPADFPYVKVPPFSHVVIEYNLLHLPLEMQPNVGYQILFYTKEIGRQRKLPSATLNPSSFEIKEAGSHQNFGLLHFTFDSTNATYLQTGAAILTGRFDRFYYHEMFRRTAKFYIDVPRRTRDVQPGIEADDLDHLWQFFAVLNRIDTDQADTKSILPTNLPLLMENGGMFSFLPQNNTQYCESKFRNGSLRNQSQRALYVDICETDRRDHVSFPVTNELATIFPSGVTFWRDGLQCEICHYDPGGVIEEGFWGEGGGLENCGKQFINFANPMAEEDLVTFNKTRPYRVSHLQVSDTSRQMDLLYEPFQTFVTTSYLPYFSNCYKHGLRMSIFRLMEDPETCTFVKDRLKTAINPDDFFPTSLFRGEKGDECVANLTCIYDEFTTGIPGGVPENSVFWFQRRERPLFYLTKKAQNISRMLRSLSTGTKGQFDWEPAREDVVSDAAEKKELVPVYVDVHDSTGSVQGDLQYMPRDVKFIVKYYTERLERGGSEKVIMSASISVGRYEQLVPTEECNSICQYKRRRYNFYFEMKQMDIIEMVNNFGLSTSAYIFLSMVFAAIVPFCVFSVWLDVSRRARKKGLSVMTSAKILRKMIRLKWKEFENARRTVTKALAKTGTPASDAQVEKYFEDRLGILYEPNTFRSLHSRLKPHSLADKNVRKLERKISQPWNIYRLRFMNPLMAGFGMLLLFYCVTVGWTFALYHKAALGGSFTDLVPTNPALIRNIYELTLPRCIDRRSRGEQIDAGSNCLTEYFINFNRGIRVAFLLWMVGIMGIVVASNMMVYYPPKAVKTKRKIGERVKQQEATKDNTDLIKETTWKWFHYCNFMFVSQFIVLAFLDSSSVPSFKKDPLIFWTILIMVKITRIFAEEYIFKEIAEDEMQASGMKVVCGVTEFMMTVTASPTFVSFCIANQLLLLVTVVTIWKDSLLRKWIEALLQDSVINRQTLVGTGKKVEDRRSYDIPLPDGDKQKIVLQILLKFSVSFCAFLSYCLIMLLLLIFQEEYSRFTVQWQHVVFVFANIPFIPLMGFYLLDIEEKHGNYGTYVMIDRWANIARGDVKRRFLWLQSIARDTSPALLEERYDPKRKEVQQHTLLRSSCVFVPIAQYPNLEIPEAYREVEKLGFTMRFFMGIFFQGFSTMLMAINMSGNMISWPTIDMVGMIFAIISIVVLRNVVKTGGNVLFSSLKLYIHHNLFVEEKLSKIATSEADKQALRRKEIEDLVSRIYKYRDEGKPDSQLVKVLTARLRDLVGDQIQKEDEILQDIALLALEKENSMAAKKRNVMEMKKVKVRRWPQELTKDVMVDS